MAIRPPVLTASQRETAFGPGCATKTPAITAGRFVFDGRTFVCHKKAEPAFWMLEQIRAEYDYHLTGNDSGTYNCRNIGGSLVLSAHAKGTAFDIDWLNNPDGKKLVTPSFPKGMIRDTQLVRTNSGAWVWRWGGDWDRKPDTPHTYYDPMHFEMVAHPLDLATGIVGLNLEEDMTYILDKSQKQESNAVKKLQARLNQWQEYNVGLGLARAFPPLDPDGVYGTDTEAAVKTYQRAAGFPVTGRADAMTIAYLFDTGE